MKMKLSPPWITWANELKAMFKYDKDVKIVFDQEEMVISLYVANPEKADAITELMPVEKTFGNIIVKVCVIPGNVPGTKYPDIMRTAFEGNPAFVGMQEYDTPFGHMTYCVWSCEPAQFYDDNLGSPWGYKTILFEDIARDVFKDQTHFNHCTEEM